MIEASSKYGKGKKVPIFDAIIKIGRSDSCNIRFTDKFSNVSREHLILKYLGNKIEIIPLHSINNKTYANNKEINKSAVINKNTTIRAAYKGPRLKIILNESAGFLNIKSIEWIDVAIICSILLFLILSIKIIIQLVK